MKLFVYLILTIISIQQVFSQACSLSVKTWVSEDITHEFEPNGRIFLFLSESSRNQPRLNTWPDRSDKIFATNLDDWQAGDEFIFNEQQGLTRSVDVSLDHIPHGDYRIQILWDQNSKGSDINAPGNLYSEPVFINFTSDLMVELPISKLIKPEKLADHRLLKEVVFKSEVLSDWWEKDIWIKAAVLLPSGFYDEPERKYPVRYNIAGYGGRYTRANRFVKWDKAFLGWWLSEEAPQIISVFLDGEGPFGDCYQLDSENNGPYGTALIEELMPYIEKKFRAIGTPGTRFLDGCSTGGWVSLALQLFYPCHFNGCFSYSPDPLDFENFQLINIYRDDNAFYNEYGYLRPVSRDITGDPVISQKDFVQFENVLGWDDTYVTSGGQFGGFNALFSPKGKDDLPKPLFDPYTGEIDREVAEHWKKYDLKHYVQNNWKTLGPKIQGKIWIWMGDMDNFYLNTALHAFDKMLKKTDNPKSDATIEFTPMSGHCSEYNHKKVILQIKERISQ